MSTTHLAEESEAARTPFARQSEIQYLLPLQRYVRPANRDNVIVFVACALACVFWTRQKCPCPESCTVNGELSVPGVGGIVLVERVKRQSRR